MDPAAKAAAIGVYGDRTGYLPRRALDTLLALAVTGEAGNRVGATRHLLHVFDTDPTARDRVPPMLATAADLVGALSFTGQIPPNRITDLVDTLLRDALTGKATGPSSPGATPDKGTAIPLPHFLPDVMLDKDADLSNPGLILLASAQSGASGEADAPADDRQAQAAEGQAESNESREDTEDADAGVVEDEHEDTLFPADEEDGAPDPSLEPEFPPDQLAQLTEIASRLSPPGGAPGLSGAEAADRNIATLDAMKRAASEDEKEFGKLVLSLVPGLGTVIDGGDAIAAFREAERLEAEGRLDDALDKRGEGTLAAFGALPLIGVIAKAPKAAQKFKQLFDRLSPGRRAAKQAQATINETGFDPAIKTWSRLKPSEPKAFNDDFVQRHTKVNPGSTPHPPYDEKFPVVRGRYRPGQPPLVRVYANEKSRVRAWLMTRADYEEALKKPDPAGFLKEKFALPERPKFVSDFMHDQPVNMKVGIASKHPTWGAGGGRQFELGEKVPDKAFTPARRIDK